MDITIYLPDELGRWAKDNGLNLSRMLRDAVTAEQESAERLKSLRGETAIHKLEVETDHEHVTVRLHAKELAWDGANQWLYMTPEGAVLVYSADAQRLYGPPSDEPYPAVVYAGSEDEFVEWYRFGGVGFYLEVLRALGRRPVIDIGGASEDEISEFINSDPPSGRGN